jgi:hypothetical protein
MSGDILRRTIRSTGAAAAVLIAASLSVCARQAQKPTPPDSASGNAQTTSSADLATLAELVRQLQAQVQRLSAKVDALQAQQQSSEEETEKLRQDLAAAKAQLAAANGAVAGPSDPQPMTVLNSSTTSNDSSQSATSSSTATATTEDQNIAQRLDKIEEDQQLADAKIDDQNQTKVEGGSKYRLRLSGIVLLNLFDDRGPVDNLDFPELTVASAPPVSNSAFGGSLRQSQISLEGFGPDIFGAKTSANVTFDFAGGFPDAPYGDATGVARLRTGTIRFDWGNTSVVAGQDDLFFAPLYPTSYASLAVPALSYAGELWAWVPQVRIEHRIHLSNSSTFTLQAGVLDALSGEYPASEYARVPTAGEASGAPAAALRGAWSHSLFGENLTIGMAGYYSRQNWGFDQNVNAWAAMTDISLPIGKYVDLSGSFYRGNSVGGIGGGIGQSIVATGAVGLSTTDVDGLDSEGGWAQVKIKPWAKVEVNVAFGQDNPFAKELRMDGYYWSQNSEYELLSKNWAGFGNVIYHPRSDVVIALEYRRLRTFESQLGSTPANVINLSMGYMF